MFLHHVVVARIEPLSKAEEILQLKAWLDEDTGCLWNLWKKKCYLPVFVALFSRQHWELSALVPHG